MNLITEEYGNKAIVFYTLNPKVGLINRSYLKHKELSREQIPSDLFTTLETPG